MYKVVIVDDEPWALLGIKNCYDWGKGDFHVICATTVPQEAIDVILKDKPDVIFTDICMPEISGIDIMRAVRNAGLDSEFIVVSGHNDFNYAQEAITYRTFHYITKPLDKNNVTQIMTNLISHLHKKSTFRETLEYTNMLFSFPDDPGTVVSYLKNTSFPKNCPFYQVVVACGISSNEADIISFPQDTYYKKIYLGESKYVFFLNTQDDIYGYALGHWNDENLFVNSVFGISTLAESLQDIGTKYREADIAVNNKFMLYEDRINRYSKVDTIDAMQYVNNIIAKIDFNDTEGLKKTLNEIPAGLKERKLRIDALALFYNQLLSNLSYKHLDMFVSAGLEFMTYDQFTKKFIDIRDLVNSLIESLTPVKNDVSEAWKTDNVQFKKILEYIDENFDKQLYLTDIADKFYLNPNHLCDLFRQSVGKTFVEYLTLLRLKKAKVLLRTTDYPVFKIAEMSGYGDYCYFGKVFKKYYGVSPNGYRNKKLNKG